MDLPPIHKAHKLKINPKLLLQIAFPIILLTIIPLQLAKLITFKSSSIIIPNNNQNIAPTTNNNQNIAPTTTTSSSSLHIINTGGDLNDTDHDQVDAPPRPRIRQQGPVPRIGKGKCDIFRGEWVPNAEGPYYTNTSCWAIHEHQNCMKYGRADSEFINWKWKPDGCDLPLFNPTQFLEVVKAKSLAFVGDSVARNHMQSLICLLSPVEYPINVANPKDEHIDRWHYQSYNFTLVAFWSPFLVKAQQNDPNGPTGTGIFGLHLDEPDPTWATRIDDFDYIVLSSGHWFFRSMMYYQKAQLIGCRFCQIPNVKDFTVAFGYRAAFRVAFQAILGRDNFKGVVYLRTFAPSHFEGGEWNTGGNCLRQRPFESNEISLQGVNLELYMAQLDEFKKAQKTGLGRGLRMRVMDMTHPMLLRPDGHPSRYGHWAHENVTLYNDCVHWCLPGPIDTWSEFLLEMLRTEGVPTNKEMATHPKQRKLKNYY